MMAGLLQPATVELDAPAGPVGYLHQAVARDQALAELSQQRQSIQQLGNTMMIEVAKQLPPELMGGAIELAGC